MQGWRKTVLIMCAGLCAVIGGGLILMAVTVDLSAADQVASIVGALAGLAGLTVSLWFLAAPPRWGVEAVEGAVAAGGSIARVVRGDNNQLSTPSASLPPGAGAERQVRAAGTGSTAAGGSIGESVTGDGNTL